MIEYLETPLAALRAKSLEIDVTEHGDEVYYWQSGELVVRAASWDRPGWDEHTWDRSTWLGLADQPGVRAWGAFEEACLLGMIVYRPAMAPDTAQLLALFVSRDQRRRGIAAHLTGQLIEQARQDGFRYLYVSATPSRSAVNFYRSQGFVPTQNADPAMFALEPEDIHMRRPL